ncbi:MAG: hypothetical protein WC722_17720 [Rhodospirillales bacterium]|jgi:hypothetical protein
MTLATMASGRIINLLLPSPDTISIHDIATGLATANRFNGATAGRDGQCTVPYTVAQHSTVVSCLIEQLHVEPLIALQALLHDGHKAITGEITTPCQEALGDGLEYLLALQRRLDIAIHAGLGLPWPDAKASDTIRFADRKAFATEWRDMMPGQIPRGYPAPANFHVKAVPWHKALELFMKQFDRLSMLAGIHPPKIPNLPTGINK